MSERSDLVAAGPGPPSPEIKRRVRDLLARGGLCALPTETVYGLAARADNATALTALRALKGRPAELAFTWHVSTRSVIERFESLRPLARRLAERYWPGPLTLVLRGTVAELEGVTQNGWTGLRLPAHSVAQGLLEACEFPVVVSSANRHGEEPATNAEDVRVRFGAALELVVDGGPSRLGEASGVLAVGPGRFDLLREGLLCIEELRRTAGLRIAFVCTGNTCRSPMAEALARALLRERLEAPGGSGRLDLGHFGFELCSLGTSAASGAPASTGAREVLAERGIDLSTHRSRLAVPESLLRCDRIYCLTHGHLEVLRGMLPPGRLASLQLLDPEREDIADPHGDGRAAYKRALVAIERALHQRLNEWA